MQVDEGDEITVTVTAHGLTAGGIGIDYNYAGTAASVTDYHDRGNPARVDSSDFVNASSSGVSVIRKRFTIRDDTIAEADETIIITLTNISLITGTMPSTFTSTDTLTITILANDGHADQRVVHILTITGPATLTETDADSMSGDYTVTRTGDEFTASTTVNLAVTHTSTSAADITVPASVTFAAGDDEQTFQVTVTGDSLNEAAEMFSLRTAGGSGLTHA
ncbi:MAG: hypothetical protein OXU94_07630, partial [Gammaproteobacteria bacterium]|nr:hypothetical protein [Gammaproteobacteria bacterium]